MTLLRLAWRNLFRNRRRTALTAAAGAFLVFESHLYRIAAEGLAVQSGHGRARLVAFHFNESKAATFARENIGCQSNRPHGAKFRKQLRHAIFRCI